MTPDELARRALARGLLSPPDLANEASPPPFEKEPIAGHELLAEIGRGGAGVVYRGRAPDGSEVAIKVLKQATKEALAFFEREIRLQSRLSESEGFVPVRASGVDRGVPYLVMPLVPGGTLRGRLRRGRLGLDETLALGRSVARALGRAHALGLVHRDVKPENLLFDASGRVLVADLGIAKHWSKVALGASRSVALSRTGQFRGTFGYMAPEQMSNARDVLPSADVYSLGAVLYECLAGEPAFAYGPLHRLGSPSTPAPIRARHPEVPEPVARALARALEVNPARRFPDGDAFAVALDAAALPREAPGPRRRLARMAGVWLGAALGAVLVGASAAARGVWAPSMPLSVAPRPGALASVASGAAALANARRHLGVARELLRRGERAGALQAASSAVASGDSLAEARLILAELRLGSREFARAEEDASRAIELDPRLAKARALRAEARFRTKTPEAALEDARRSVELDPGLVLGHVVRAEAERRLEHPGEAVAAASSALALDPLCARALAIRLESGSLSLSLARRLLELDPVLHRAVGRTLPSIFRPERTDDPFAKPRSLEDLLDQPSDGLVWSAQPLQDLLARFPDAPTLWLERSRDLEASRDFKGALGAAEHALALDPGEANAWCARGRLHETLGDRVTALADMTRALELDHGVHARKFRAAIYTRLGTPEARLLAEADLVEERRRVPDDPDVLALLVAARLGNDHLAGALEDVAESLRRGTNEALGLELRARCRIHAGDVAGARQDLERALELAPEAPWAKDARKLLETLPGRARPGGG